MASQGVFQHTAARRRLARWSVSNGRRSSFNTQPPEGGWALCSFDKSDRGCFNTQPPEGGWAVSLTVQLIPKAFQHTAARRRLVTGDKQLTIRKLFQHTAARRRLDSFLNH